MMNEAFQRIESQFNTRIENISEEELKEIELALELLQKKYFMKKIILNFNLEH
ncbi:hypothetical protein [Salipaludibacillus neizhouensis]|uniref:hypothetical protein n=2 Tax=Salipaludibacillus neizhouensis TaxID=885475 RepID=UPI00167ECAD3|nr:hypothetical protein [Salipaludibacillus neizhouensis]